MTRASLSLLSAMLLLPLTGSDLNVTDPDIITPDNLGGASALPTIRAAAIGDFALSYAGSGADGSSGTEGIVTMGGLLGDEFINSETFPTRIEIDRRSTQVTNGTLAGWFRTVSRARRSAEFAAGRFRALADTTTDTGLSEMLSLAGYTYLWFAENWCSGVPFTTINPDGSLTYGQPLTTQQMFDTAAKRFTQALNAANALNLTGSAAAAKTRMIGLAKVGLGRTLLNQANFAGAQAAVSGVATSFVYTIQHSETSTRENNGVFVATVVSQRYSVADREGINAPDPSVPPIAAMGPLPRFDTLSVAGRQDLHFKEREFWLWLTAHRLGDLRRLARAPYNRPPESVFPSGPYFKGGVYGTDYNFPVPFDETNNPNFAKCIDRNP